ncbi:MAG: two-component regulator propeller domain-containing protein, partial [Planctomycetota bacterium]|nr:two-component regulator propeller domain-containing protein [Planctomycetota bacterium]
STIGRFVRDLAITVGAFTVILLLFSTNSVALDSTRKLTQSLHRIWQVPQGLPQATILASRQASSGFLWLGTQAGLVRFDGVRFVTVPIGPAGTLEEPAVQDLLEDSQRHLWIATNSCGLVKLENRNVSRYDQSSGLPSDNIHCLLLDRHNQLIVGTSAGAAKLQGDRFTGLQPPENAPSNTEILALVESADGTIWGAGRGPTLYGWNGARRLSRTLKLLPESVEIRALHMTKTGTLWVGTSAGLLRVQGDEEKLLTTADGLADNSVYCLLESVEGSLFVGTRQGFARVNANGIEDFGSKNGLSQSTVYTICEDQEGNLWVGTKHGLNQFLDRRSIPFTVSEGLASNNTGPICQDAQDAIWIGSLDRGISRYNEDGFKILTTKQGLVSNIIQALAVGAEGEVFVGTDLGMNVLQNEQVKQTFQRDDGLPSNDVRCILASPDGSMLVATSEGLVSYRDGKFESHPASDLLHGTIVTMTYFEGDLLLATMNGGLFRSRKNDLEAVLPPDIPRSEISSLHVDTEEILWIGTHGGGLSALQNERFTTYTLADGLYDDDILGIAQDGQDRLWMACSKGVFSVARQELLQRKGTNGNRISNNPFTPLEALRTVECQSGVQPAVLKTRDGTIWFSTIHGAMKIDPRNWDRPLPVFPVVVEEVVVNGQIMQDTTSIELSENQNNLSFRYTALNLRAPTRIEFRYMLEGFDSDWIDAKSRREAFYTNLRPGGYRFRALGINLDGTTYEAANPIQFTIHPVFYRQTWFMTSLIVTLALAAWGAIWLRIRGIKSHMRAIVLERSRIARELHDTLMQGFSGITMEMQALSTSISPSPQHDTLNEIIGDAGECLREARLSIAGLRSGRNNAETSDLAASISQAARQLTETSSIQLRLRAGKLPATINDDVKYNLLRITQEAIANAVKYSGARNLDVTVEANLRTIHLSIIDDGVGFVLENGLPSEPGHFGILGMRERASSIGGTFQLSSAPEAGTRVDVIAPIRIDGALPINVVREAVMSPLSATPKLDRES